MRDVDIDIISLVGFLDHSFRVHKDITFDQFMDEVCKFKSSNACTVKDALDIQVFLIHELHKIQDQLSLICKPRSSSEFPI